MHKKIFIAFLFTFFICSTYAQVQSPEQFLGYKIGTKYTPHWRIVEYYKHVAANASSTVKLQPYGHTHEGRPLMVAFVSAPNHISNLENIRTTNLGFATGKAGNVNNVPAIVWLSYNVHGNETSSSEAGMLTLFALVDPTNQKTKQWLQNTVVVMDPCLNPDGRDRYVNWFNSVVGKTANPVLAAREHREPWPGGRSNHYNFDLNRDWAWQTQIESQQRLKLYNEWLPQIHVDFHEQGINSPYYFAPAAEPFHETITPFQRSFQKTIGSNHAKYFDEKGWLYFTRERFDLLYPSYGDTYPVFSGAIGMTYEQGGGGAGGLAVMDETNDTLTLYDRAIHHYTTGLSTIEVASGNATKLVSEFQNFYKSTVANINDYKAYVIKNNPADAGRIYAMMELFKKNKIEFSTAKGTDVRGFNYTSGKEENFSVADGDIVIPAAQQKATLLKVLFEPQTKLADSATYDITAWALPYVYGVQAYATRQAISISGNTPVFAVNNSLPDAYGYAIPWHGVQSVKLVSALLQKGIKLRVSEQPFTVGNKQFERGAVIVLKTSNQYLPHLWDTVRQLANKFSIQLSAVASGFVDKGYDLGSGYVKPILKPRVAMLTGEGVSSLGAGEVWHFFEQVIDYPITLINANDAGNVSWSNYDVLIMPDGNYRFLNDKPQSDALKAWVQSGGKLIALERAVSQLAKQEWSIKLKKADETDSKDVYAPLRKYEDRERDEIPNITPGSIFRVELDNTHPLAFGFPKYYYTLKQDDAIYDFIKEDGWNVGVIKKEKQVAGFVGSKLQSRLRDGLLFGVQNLGRGTITYLADDVLFRSFWENGKLLFSNAVFMVGQ